MSEKVYDVPAEWSRRAFIDDAKYREMYARSIKDPNGFWAEQAKRIDWIKPFSKVKNTTFGPGNVSIKWFEDGTLNACFNCVDRHVAKRGDRVAILWEGDDPKDDKKITYKQLHAEVQKFANVLKARGVKKGDRVTIYLPMIPEAAYAMLACARIGAIHSVVFGGFSPDSLAGRIEDAKSNIIITADEGVRGGRKIPLKANADAAADKAGGVTTILVVRRTGAQVPMKSGRDLYYDDIAKIVPAECPCEEMSAEDPLFILYTSGSTGKPKGVLHTTGGYLVYTSLTHQYVFDYHDGDIYWCTADVGWVTGHSYIVYGPLANGALTMMFEGVPNYPTVSRFWEVVDKHKVNIIYTAPTAIRALMQAGDAPVKKTSRASLRLLGTVGEPINPEAWEWYYRVVGDGRCPIVDTWWQTETGGILITPLPGATRLKPGSATRPFFGVVPQIVDNDGKVLEGPATGNLCIADSWPGQMRTVFGDHQRFVDTYFNRRRLPARRGRLLLDHRSRGRCDQRRRPPARHRRNRERARGASQMFGGRGGRLSAPHQRAGHLCLRDADGRGEAKRRTAERVGAMGAQGDRPDRPTGPDPVRAGPAEDALGKNHAAHPAQDRGGRFLQPRRHLDTRGPRGGRRSRQQPAEPEGPAEGGERVNACARMLPKERCRRISKHEAALSAFPNPRLASTRGP
jgi:acetyl-CoA synthetase